VVRPGVMRTLSVSKGLHVGGVHVHHGERVVGDGDEELVVERSVDEAEHVQLARLHLQPERACGTRIICV
jgi:hypothetical protein